MGFGPDVMRWAASSPAVVALASLAVLCALVACGCGVSPSQKPGASKRPPGGASSQGDRGGETTATQTTGAATTAGENTLGETTAGETTGAFGQAAVLSGGKFPVKLGPDGTEDPKLWPDACKMLTNREIRAIVPNVTKISRHGRHAEILGGGETPNYSDCDYKVPRPSDPYGPGRPSTIGVSLRGVADPGLIRQQYEPAKKQQARTTKKHPDQYIDYGTSLGGADCFWDGNEIECIKGHFGFWVMGQQATVGNALQADRRWRDETLTKVVETLAAKMS